MKRVICPGFLLHVSCNVLNRKLNMAGNWPYFHESSDAAEVGKSSDHNEPALACDFRVDCL